ncbi:MAG: hypothetical protein ACOYLB_15360 [Phototrophicaceae bacterium]
MDNLADLRELLYHLRTTFDLTTPEQWETRTGTREKDWTLNQAFAHLASVAKMLNHSLTCLLHDQPFEVEGIHQRGDLKPWVIAQLERRAQQNGVASYQELLTELETTVTLCQQLTRDAEARHVDLMVYNRPTTFAESVLFHLSHAGVVHAAQITRPLGLPPLWQGYSSAFRHRQLERFLQHMSVVYWYERGGEQTRILNMVIDGEEGGAWHIHTTPTTSITKVGEHPDAFATLHFADTNTLFGLFTSQFQITTALRERTIHIDGDMRETLAHLQCFNPT